VPAYVRSAGKNDVRPVARMLARAFQDDPMMQWVLPDADGRTRAVSRMFAAMARYHYLSSGVVEMAETASDIAAAALWAPPDRWRESPLETLRMMPSLLWGLRSRVSAFKAILDAAEHVHPEEPHWYLAVIGSDPKFRAKGFAHALIRKRLEHCDATNTAVYLEASNTDNVPYYERFGFKVRREFSAPNGCPPLFAMWRTPIG
jgi:ribosomal protein S18 acetylase RimI-like enzyme